MLDTLLEMRGITKIYSNGFVANKDINFSVAEGEIHALMGENGAGKSTLMKILFGIETPEEGEILLNGKPIKINNPLTAINYGIGWFISILCWYLRLLWQRIWYLEWNPAAKGCLA